jgi:hypothetical protein
MILQIQGSFNKGLCDWAPISKAEIVCDVLQGNFRLLVDKTQLAVSFIL